jgi:hypothetical protein
LGWSVSRQKGIEADPEHSANPLRHARGECSPALGEGDGVEAAAGGGSERELRQPSSQALAA